MTTLIGLFKSEQEAETAVQSLAAANLEDLEFKTISNWERDREAGMKLMATPNSGANPSSVPVAAAIPAAVNLNSEETRYFKRTVQDGGVMLVVDVDDDEQVPQVKEILQETGDKLTIGS